MGYSLVRATNDERDTLWRLLQYSLYEESACDGNAPDARGIYGYQFFDDYFNSTNRHEAYLIRSEQGDQLLGFAMIHNYTKYINEGWSVAEFMILPNARRKHIGERAAAQLFALHPGEWELSPSAGSEVALNFWQKVISECASEFEFRDGTFIFRNTVTKPEDPVCLSNCDEINDFLTEHNKFHDYWLTILDYDSESSEARFTIQELADRDKPLACCAQCWSFVASGVNRFRSVTASIEHGFPIDEFYFVDGRAVIEGYNGGIIIRADEYRLSAIENRTK